MLKWFIRLQDKFIASPFLPTKQDVENIKELARILKGGDDAETLVNVLEWMERNLTYWTERGYLDPIWSYFLMTDMLIALLLIFPLLWLFLSFISYLFLRFPLHLSLISSLVIIIVLFLLIFKGSFFRRILFIIASSFFMYWITLNTVSQPVEVLTRILIIAFTYYFITGGIIFTLIYLVVIYLPLVEYFENMPKKKAIIHLIRLTFTPGLPVKDMLKLRKGVCRDYARFAASLLAELFPHCKKFFVQIPQHVAVGIEVGGRVYIIDQKLPVLSPEAWLNIWNKDHPLRILELKQIDNKFTVKTVSVHMRRNIILPINFGKELIKIVEKTYYAILRSESTVTHVLRDYAKVFELDDKVIYLSFLRKIRLTLEKELLSHSLRIKDIKLSKNNNDIIVTISIN